MLRVHFVDVTGFSCVKISAEKMRVGRVWHTMLLVRIDRFGGGLFRGK